MDEIHNLKKMNKQKVSGKATYKELTDFTLWMVTLFVAKFMIRVISSHREL
jgi:hypothetical protein